VVVVKFRILRWLGIVCFGFVQFANGQGAGGFLGFGSGKCVLHYVSEPTRIQRFDICTSQALPDFNTTQLPDPRGIQQVESLSDGGLIVANVSVVARFREDGTLARIYDKQGEDCWSGIALERSENAFWASSSCHPDVTRFDLSPDTRMFGGGRQFTSTGMQVNYGMDLHCDASIQPNYLQVTWGGGNVFVLENMTRAACTGAPFHTHSGSGTGAIDGQPGATIEWTMVDAGQPGVMNDNGRVVIKDAAGAAVLEVSGKISGGSHIAK
jgi:hypothetical protein